MIPAGFEHEELVVRRGRRSGATMAVAVHSTALGPALGGLRLWHYARDEDGVADVLRLASGMTMKAAAAGLDLGGGKGVICSPEPAAMLSLELRRAILLDFGDLVESLGGSYITAEDVGVDAQDMAVVAERTAHVTGLPQAGGGAGDPSPFTAIGVEAAMRACIEARFGTRELLGMGVVVIGLGHVGSRLAMRMRAAGARLVVSDTDPAKRELAERLDARWVEPSVAASVECDLLAPCALGGAIGATSAERLRTQIVCGAANNQLADDRLAERLAERDVLYAPDFIANAGGLINVYREVRGYDEDQALEMAMDIEETMRQVLITSEERSVTPLEAAIELARERLDCAVRH